MSNPMRLHQLPLLGSNQDSPDPESAVSPTLAGDTGRNAVDSLQIVGGIPTKTHTITNTPAAEVWRAIPGYSGFDVSSRGRVRPNETGADLRLHDNGHGYLSASLSGRLRYVHRLVAAAFIGEADGREVDHLNAVRDDNRPENLEYVTRAENARRAFDRLRPAVVPTCAQCPRATYKLRTGLCHRCYEYKRRTGTDRPVTMTSGAAGIPRPSTQGRRPWNYGVRGKAVSVSPLARCARREDV